MKPLVLQVLLLPVHAILAWLYLVLRADVPRTGWRGWDWGVIAVAVAAWIATPYWAEATATPDAGPIWPVVLATFVAFLVFSAVLFAGWSLRTLLGRR